MMRHVAVFLTVCIAFVMSACSGGDGGGAPQISPPPSSSETGFKLSGLVTEQNEPATYVDKPAIGVTIRVEPGGRVATTGSDGQWSLSVPNGSYTVSAAHGTRTLAPATVPVTVNNAPVAGLNFTEEIPVGAKTFAYIGRNPAGYEVLKRTTSAGVTETLFDNPDIRPINLVPFRGGVPRIAFDAAIGGAVSDGGIRTISSTGTLSLIVPDSGFLVPGYLSATAGRVFDTIHDPGTGGEYVVFSSPCPPGPLCASLQNDVFVVIADGSLMNLRVTNDGVSKVAPVFAGEDPVTGYVTILYLLPLTNEVWKQVINPSGAASLVGSPTRVATGVQDGFRPLAVNSDYTRIAFTRVVGDATHVIVTRFDGSGGEVDLGEGVDPFWALDDPNTILFTASEDPVVKVVVRSDGTGKVEIPVPDDLTGSPAWMVLLPEEPS